MFSRLLGPVWLRWAWRAPHVIAMTSLIGCNTKIVAGIFDMLNFMIISLQQLARLFYFILAVLFYLYGGLYCSQRFQLSLLSICGLPATAPSSRPRPCWLQGVGYDAGPCLLGESARRCQSEAAFDWCVGQSGAKRNRWHDRPVAFTTSCPCPCKRGTFWTVFVTCIWTSSYNVTTEVEYTVLIRKCLCFWQLSFHKVVQQHV